LDILLLVTLLLLSATFSSSETAFFALSATERNALRSGGRAARGAALLIDRANDLLSAILLGNLVVNVAIGAVSTRICLKLFGPGGVAIAVPAATLLLLVVGEITPKLVALRGRVRLVRLLQAPLRLWVGLTGPLVRSLTGVIERVLARLPMDRSGSRPLSTDELQLACDLAAADGVLTETEGNFLARLLQLEDLEVQHVMTPRPDVRTLHRDWDRARIVAHIADAGFNRFPVVEQEGGMPDGLFHTKDLLTSTSEHPLVGGLRPLLYVPETNDVAAVMARMRAGDGHLAAVIDEHGDFAGVVTLADCLQALIGRVGDPGTGRPPTVALAPGVWLVDGSLDLRQLHEETGLSLPRSRDYVTVAGFVMAALGRIPRQGDRVRLPSADLAVVAMAGHRVLRLRINRRDQPAEAGS
jgi:CBS domain containing-hemolysin-like protein